MSVKRTIFKYLFEFVIVFAGVFCAFLLNEYKDRKAEEARKREVYQAIYEDLMSFYESGKRENAKGFLMTLKANDMQMDSLIADRNLPSKYNLYGDYWQILIINSLMNSGVLKEIDIQTFKKISKFYSVHQNFLMGVEDFNEFYGQNITANFDKGIDYYYKPGTDELKDRFVYLQYVFEGLENLAEILVDGAYKIAQEIKEEHLQE
ncbi:hypothetical protein [Fulvivirga ligni]|uniref:hypothetical protein n=1 Tax=Fulvivirga ligni TaxID=2904246 RepID=UPI001F408DD2|nr:hypothetical protein [Fulvivirga ligni]UII20947.1 hypothetical protein LVD16_24185 [Fulvivirga ligni]